ncbi:MAG: DUF1552 domain-containing protein [bacterium]
MRFTRRNFLQAMGFGAGAFLFAPFTNSIARAQATGPKRFVVVIEGNCIEPIAFLSGPAQQKLEADSTGVIGGKRWFGRSYTHDSPIEIPNSNLSSAPALSPLSVTGELDLSDKSAVVFGLSNKVAGGGHTTHCGALSCTRSTAAAPGDQTIDHWLGQQAAVRNGTPYDVMRLGISASSAKLAYQTCAFGKGNPAPIIVDPTTAFNQAFGSVATGAGQMAFSERSQLLDFAHADATRALNAFSGNSRERFKLEQYLQSLEQVAMRQEQIATMSDALLAARPTEPGPGTLYVSADPIDNLQAQFDIATASLIGGLTNVAVIASATGDAFDIAYPSIVPDIKRHDLHHQSGNVPAFVQAIHDVTRAHVSFIAQMARTLAATPEVGGDGSMLDHTVIVYLPDNGEQHHSNSEEWPVLLVGGQAMGFLTDGRTVVYPNHANANNRQVSNLFNSMGFAAGTELLKFGTDANRVAEGELTEIWRPV